MSKAMPWKLYHKVMMSLNKSRQALLCLSNNIVCLGMLITAYTINKYRFQFHMTPFQPFMGRISVFVLQPLLDWKKTLVWTQRMSMFKSTKQEDLPSLKKKSEFTATKLPTKCEKGRKKRRRCCRNWRAQYEHFKHLISYITMIVSIQMNTLFFIMHETWKCSKTSP